MSRPEGARRLRRPPERMCVVCRTRQPKERLVRVARLPDGQVVVDETAKGPGRGAYVCARRACWLQPGLAARLGHVLKAELSVADRAQLTAVVAAMPEDSDGG
jgi:hypothetical protein